MVAVAAGSKSRLKRFKRFTFVDVVLWRCGWPWCWWWSAAR